MLNRHHVGTKSACPTAITSNPKLLGCSPCAKLYGPHPSPSTSACLAAIDPVSVLAWLRLIDGAAMLGFGFDPTVVSVQRSAMRAGLENVREVGLFRRGAGTRARMLGAVLWYIQ